VGVVDDDEVERTRADVAAIKRSGRSGSTGDAPGVVLEVDVFSCVAADLNGNPVVKTAGHLDPLRRSRRLAVDKGWVAVQENPAPM
jgi:hypothetical protein